MHHLPLGIAVGLARPHLAKHNRSSADGPYVTLRPSLSLMMVKSCGLLIFAEKPRKVSRQKENYLLLQDFVSCLCKAL